MNYDELVNSIVEELYKRLNEKKYIETNLSKKKAVVLWSRNIDDYSKIASRYEVLTYKDGLREYDVVIIESLCLRGLANLASGSSISKEERFILKAIMMGKKVYVMEKGLEYKRYIETAPKELYKKYISFERELRNYGVQIIDKADDIIEGKTLNFNNDKDLLEEISVEHIKSEEIISLNNKKLISESDLRKPHIRGAKVIKLDKKAIVTPLASDYIRINNLKLERV